MLFKLRSLNELKINHIRNNNFMKPHDTKNQASESHREKVHRAKKNKFKKPRKKRKFYIEAIKAKIETNMSEKEVLEAYSLRYPEYEIKIKKL